MKTTCIMREVEWWDGTYKSYAEKERKLVLWFVSGMSSPNSSAVDLVLNSAMSKGEALGKWLDYESSNITGGGGLSHLIVWMDYFGKVEPVGSWDRLEEVDHWGHAIGDHVFTLAPSNLPLYFLASMSWTTFLPHVLPSWYLAWPQNQSNEAGRLWIKIKGQNEFLFHLRSTLGHSDKKLANTIR